MSENEQVGATAADDAEWWQADGLPWQHKPTREELWCYGLLMFYSLYSLVMMPLRAWLLTVPFVSAILNGSRTAITMVGALAQTGNAPLWGAVVTLLLSILSAVKWDLLYWWAGKLWGHAFVASVAGQKGRAKRFSDALERLAVKRPGLSMLVTYLPIPFTVVVYVVLGQARYPWRRFLAWDLVCSAVFNTGYFLLGWFIGQPAVDLLKVYSRYALWFALVLMVVAFVMAYRQQRARLSASPGTPDGPAAAPAGDDEERPARQQG